MDKKNNTQNNIAIKCEVAAQGPLIACISLLIEQPIDCKVIRGIRKVEVCEILNGFSHVFITISLIAVCVEVDGGFLVASM